MAGWITNESMTGIWTLYVNVSSKREHLITYRSLPDKERGYIKAYTWQTTEATASANAYAKFRIIYKGKSSAYSGAPSVSWYNIMAVHGYTNTELGSNDFGYSLSPCYGRATFTSSSATNAQRRLTFSWKTDGNNDSSQWAFYQNSNGTYYIVNKASWAVNLTTNATGNVQYLSAAETYNTNYNIVGGQKWSNLSSNTTLGSWHMTRYDDNAIKVGDKWRKHTSAYVKINSHWKPVYASYIKKDGHWKKI